VITLSILARWPLRIGDLFGEFHDGRYPLRAEHRQ
jgi:hypothetical protein